VLRVDRGVVETRWTPSVESGLNARSSFENVGSSPNRIQMKDAYSHSVSLVVVFSLSSLSSFSFRSTLNGSRRDPQASPDNNRTMEVGADFLSGQERSIDNVGMRGAVRPSVLRQWPPLAFVIRYRFATTRRFVSGDAMQRGRLCVRVTAIDHWLPGPDDYHDRVHFGFLVLRPYFILFRFCEGGARLRGFQFCVAPSAGLRAVVFIFSTLFSRRGTRCSLGNDVLGHDRAQGDGVRNIYNRRTIDGCRNSSDDQVPAPATAAAAAKRATDFRFQCPFSVASMRIDNN